MDQTSAQNLPNSARVLVYTKDKSKIIKNPRKYRVNTVGFQAINGNSLLKFIDVVVQNPVDAIFSNIY